MPAFSSLGIFWLAFAAIFGPVFVIALICSIVKAIRFRIDFKRQMREAHTNEQYLFNEPVDAEIITTPNARRKPNIQLIEDVDRKKQFRDPQGLLSIPTAQNGQRFQKMKDTCVDAPTTVACIEHRHAPIINVHHANTNKSNATHTHFDKGHGITGSNNRVAACRHVTPASSSNKDNRNNTRSHYRNNNNDLCSSINNSAASVGVNRYTETNECSSRMSKGYSTNAFACGSRDPNGHIPGDPSGMEALQTVELDASPQPGRRHSENQSLRPGSSNANSPRRHSVNSSSPTLEKLPNGREKKSDCVEMNTARSKSEETLIDQINHNSSSSTYLRPGDQGRDNQAFARSTETTIM